jgi:hypothetical protein
MLDRKLTAYIEGSECMGTSLHTKINPSFDNLDTAVQLLSTNLATLSTTVFSLSSNTTRLISAANINNTTTNLLVTSLSSYVLPRATKAWVKFDGTTITISPCVAIFSSFNVLSVARFNTGAYRVAFTSWFVDNNYAVTTSAGTSGIYTFTLNPSPSTVEVYSQTFTSEPEARDSIISLAIHSF